MSNQETQKAILAAVDKMLLVHDNWAKDPDPRFKDTLPQEFEDAANAMLDIVETADVPAQLRDLVRCIDTFRDEWRLLLGGAHETDGTPRNALWRALRAVINARSLSAELRAKRPEPVAELLRQKVTPQQIAMSIYGHRGEGPFVTEGQIRFDLIKKEADEPGSVIPEDWIPPYEEERLRRHHIDHKNRLKTIDAKLQQDRPHVETVEGLLREGANISQICSVCNKTPEQVRAVAHALDLPIVELANLGAERGIGEPEISPERQAGANQPQPAPGHSDPIKKTTVKITRADKERVIKLAAAGMGAAEISQELKGKLSARQVAQLLQQATAAAAQTE